jgi:hypothetical protein
MARTYDECITELAEGHREVVGEPMDVYFVPDPDGQVIRLLEVSDGFVTSGEVWPITFRADEDFPFVVTVIQLTRDEYARTQTEEDRDMELPPEYRNFEKLELSV